MITDYFVKWENVHEAIHECYSAAKVNNEFVRDQYIENFKICSTLFLK